MSVSVPYPIEDMENEIQRRVESEVARQLESKIPNLMEVLSVLILLSILWLSTSMRFRIDKKANTIREEEKRKTTRSRISPKARLRLTLRKSTISD